MLIPGLVSVTFRTKTADEIISLCHAAHLQAVEWGENSHVFAGNVQLSREIAQKTADAGLAVEAYGSYYKLGQGMDFIPVLESASALQAPLIRIWAGTKPSAEVDDSLLKSLASEASEISARAADKGIKVVLEWHKNSLTDTNASAKHFLEAADSPNLYCLWQPTAALTEQEKYDGLAWLAGRECTRFGQRLANIHVYYWKNGVRAPLQDGIPYWKNYLSALKEHAETRYMMLEFVMGDTDEQFMKDAGILLQLCKGENEND